MAEAKGETLAGADVIDWFAEEARRAYGRVIPARAEGVYQLVVKEPVGPVAAFTPWNFPINQVVRKLSGALAAGCSIIVKAPEETPASPAELIRAFADAGVPAGVINLVYGVPAEISEYLIPHPVIRKISFTGSTAVGKQLAALAGPAHEARRRWSSAATRRRSCSTTPISTSASKILAANKFRNAGQVCVSPTRFLVQEKVYDSFVDKFVDRGEGGEGRRRPREAAPRWARSPTRAASRRWRASSPTRCSTGAEVAHRRQPDRQQGQFLRADRADRRADGRPRDERGAVRPARRSSPRSAASTRSSTEANRLPFGLAAYAYTRSAKTANAIAAAVESRDDVDQPPRPGAAGSAVRRREGFGLRLGGRLGGDRGLPQHEVRHPGRAVGSLSRLVVRGFPCARS